MSISDIVLRPKDMSAVPAIAFRRTVRLYLLGIAVVMLLLLLIAWSIDLAEKYAEVRDAATQRGVPLMSVLVPYLLYRAADIVTRLLPIACFVGVFVAEIMRRRRLETIIFWSAGFSPLQGLASVLAVAAILGVIQFSLERTLRPAAVFAQVDLGVGTYADRFRRGIDDDEHWFLSGKDAIRANVWISDNPELRRVEVYRGFSADRLSQVIVADSAQPGDRPNVWRLYNAIVWDRQGESYTPTSKPVLDIDFTLAPEQLTYLGVAGFYLPNDALLKIAEFRNAPNIGAIDLAIWRRWMAFLLPGAFILLGATLGQAVWSGRVLLPSRSLAFGMGGYASIVSVKVFWALGEIGSIPAFLAASLTIVLAITASAIIQFMRS